jgi:hypothetical protein
MKEEQKLSSIEQKMKNLIDKKILNIKLSKHYNAIFDYTDAIS